MTLIKAMKKHGVRFIAEREWYHLHMGCTVRSMYVACLEEAEHLSTRQFIKRMDMVWIEPGTCY